MNSLTFCTKSFFGKGKKTPVKDPEPLLARNAPVKRAGTPMKAPHQFKRGTPNDTRRDIHNEGKLVTF